MIKKTRNQNARPRHPNGESGAKDISITIDDRHERLDIFLSKRLAISRSQAQKIIAGGGVKINHQAPKKAGQILSQQDTVTLDDLSHEKSIRPNPKQNTRVIDTKKSLLKIKIIATTSEYLVIEKPSGLLTHATMANEPDTVASQLMAKYPELDRVGEDPLRPGIVHRLDKEASGLLVVARTQPMFEHLKGLFKKRKVIKEYLVLAHGRVQKDWDEILFPIKRSETTDRMAAIPGTKNNQPTTLGKAAHTEFIVEQRFVNFTLLRVSIHTGRMHQIRAHLLAYNHPVVGDPLYTQKKRSSAWDKKLGRLFLHCTQLSFTDMAGQKQVFSSPLPHELGNFLQLLA